MTTNYGIKNAVLLTSEAALTVGSARTELFRVIAVSDNSGFVERDASAPTHVAQMTNGLNIQGLVVVSMVVTFGTITAVDANLSLRMRQEAISNRHPHDSIDTIDPIYFDSARARPPNGVSSSLRNASFAVASPQISIADDLTALRTWLGVMDFEHLQSRSGFFGLAAGSASFSLLGADGFTDWRLSVVHRTDAISKIHQKQIWVIDLYLRGDAAHTPVLDPLSATFLIVETVGELSRAAEAVDDLAIGVNAIFAHGVY